MIAERQIIHIGVTKLRRYVGKLQQQQTQPSHEQHHQQQQGETVEQIFRRLVVLTTNLAHHMIGRLRLPLPDDSTEVFCVLGRAGILPMDLAERLTGVALLRAELAHGYQQIDSEKIDHWLGQQLDDFLIFADCTAMTLLSE